MRQRIYEVIEVADENDKLSTIYDSFMMIVIFVSIIPLAFLETNIYFEWIDRITVSIFIIDYILRIWTADLKLKSGAKSFLYYPFTPMAIIDLLSILPSLSVINYSLGVFKVIRLFRTFRVFRVFKAVRYSKNITMFTNVFKKEKDALSVVCVIAIMYVLVSALIVLNVEPETFENYFDAVYWATVSLTTVGYGDIYPVSAIGRLVTMISSFVGIAIVALPAGLITTGLMEEINSKKQGEKNAEDKEENKEDHK